MRTLSPIGFVVLAMLLFLSTFVLWSRGDSGTAAPTPPIRAAFFYPWFPGSWTQGGVFPYTNFTPSLGYYDSADDGIIDQQLALARQAHLDALIASWWGQATPTDIALQHIVDRSGAASPYWAVYYEAEGYSDPTADTIAADLNYLAGNLFNKSGYLQVDSRPVVFVFADGADGAGMATRWAEAKPQFPNVYVVLKVYPGYRTAPNQPDSWHQYGPAVAYDEQLPYSATVSPGFWKYGEAPRLGRDLARFEADVQRMIASGAAWQLISTWSEWGEGSQIEPAAEYGNAYIDILCQQLGPCNPDSDGDGYDDAVEIFLGTDPNQACSLTTDLNDENPDPWPPDFDDNQTLNIAALVPFKTAFGAVDPSDPAYSARYDLNMNGAVNIADLVPFKPFFEMSCVPSPIPTTTPTPTPLGDPVLVGAGDIASCGSSGDEATANLLDGIAGTVFTAGDNAYDPGTAAQFSDCYNPTWGRHKARTKPSAGNHDYNTSGASGYFNYFGAAAGEPGKGYYSYDLGAWHIISLNSNCGAIGGCDIGSAQEQWLKADLAANQTPCTAAYWHHPRYSSGDTHGSSTATQALYQALYDADADLILTGHEHNYERFAPQNAIGQLDTARGIRQFVVGMGGRRHYGFGTPLVNSEIRNATAYGVIKLTLHQSSYDWEFVPVAGQTFADSGSQACH